MHDPNFDHRLDPRVFPAWTPLTGVLFVVVIVGTLALNALSGARGLI